MSSASTYTVNLEVVPVDSQVYTRGLLRKGPPYTFEIRRGGHLAVEVVRAGYAARRVVLDGSKPEVTVGLLRKKTPAAAARPRTTANGAPEERGNVVQSGL